MYIKISQIKHGGGFNGRSYCNCCRNAEQFRTASEYGYIGVNEVIVTKNGKEVGRFIPKGAVVSYLTDSLTGMLHGDADIDSAKEKGLSEKYETAD